MRTQRAETLPRDSATRRLRDANTPVPDALLSCILDDYSGDPAVLEAMIDRPSLPSDIVLRLLGMLDPRQRARLLARHPAPDDTARKGDRRDRARPAWWTAHITAMFR